MTQSATLIELPRPAPDGTVIEILEAMLGRARRGEVNGIAIAAHVNVTDTATVYRVGQHGDVAHLVCAIERVKLRLLDHQGD